MDKQDAGASEYDRVAYPGAADPVIHLRTIQTMAAVFGLNPRPIESCRVLEIGCADGTNILPSALQFPESEFLGIDIVEDRISEATQTAAAVDVNNADFRHCNVTEVTADIGAFDYILCPGVYSWASAPEREAILHTCRDHLAPGGIAAISFNVYPGWNFRGTIRELIRRHVRFFDDPARQIAEARRVVDFVSQSTPETTPYGQNYRHALASLHAANDHYVYHDYISDRNQPFYFHEFASQLEAAKLQYVADGDMTLTSAMSLPGHTQELLGRTPVLEREQLLDFLMNTSYRRALVCRNDAEVNRSVNEDALSDSSVALVQSYRDAAFDPTDTEPLQLKIDEGSVTITDPLGKAAVQCLMEQWPAAMPIERLYQQACTRLPDTAGPGDSQTASGERLMRRAILAAVGAGMIRLIRNSPPVSVEVTNAPQVSPLVRHCAAQGRTIVNQWHQNVLTLSTDERFLLTMMNGRRSLSELESLLNDFRLRQDSLPPSSAPVTVSFPALMQKFRDACLLVPEETSPAEFTKTSG